MATWFALLLTGSALTAAGTLQVYLIDVEGGKSVLLISPTGETMLIDAGWPKLSNRESSVNAIVAVAHTAGAARIDELIVSHFDTDHMGDVPALATRLPIRHIYDHGEFRSNPNLDDAKYKAMIAGNQERFRAYDELRRKVGHTVVKAGDQIPFKGIEVRVLSAGGKTIDKPLYGAGTANPDCTAHTQQALIPRDVEDNQSIGVLFTYGKFRMLDLADLEAHVSRDLVCPDNLIGTVDVYNVNVHAQIKGIAPELVDAIRARVMLIGNGARKGGDPESYPILGAAPGLEDIWQAHFGVAGGAASNTPENLIANIDPNAHGNWIKVSASSDGSFTVINSRNHFSKSYKPTG
jgi:competence protein ComEC